MARVIIIGAGLSGLSAAYHLEKKGFSDYLIVEKEASLGGLCRSFKQDGFIFDYTGHLLHSNDAYFSSFIQELLSENLIELERRAFIYSHNTYTNYPYQINLHGLPIEIIVDCIEGFVQRQFSRKKPKSFTEWVRVDEEKTGYNATFLYPCFGGIQLLVDRLAAKIKKNIVTNCSVIEIDLTKKIVRFENGNSEPYDILINTMPLDQLLLTIHDRATTCFSRAVHKLRCAGVACLNLGISCPALSNKHWVYYPEKRYPFYRVGFYHNFSPAMVPAHCSSLYVECSYRNRSKKSVQHLIKTAHTETKKLFDFSENDIATEHILRIPHAYVIYDFWRERNLPKLLARLEQEGIYSIGRYGSWRYASMQEAVLDGKKVAEKIILQPAQQIISKRSRIKPLRRKEREKEIQ